MTIKPTDNYYTAEQMMNPAWDRFTKANPTMTPSQWEEGFVALMMSHGITYDQVGQFLGFGQ